jgi:protein-tyrosine phosphatase
VKTRRTVLFLCTGNYYRSRFAEIVFNHRARGAGLDWQATSRGLAAVFGAWNVGPISPFTLKKLAEMSIECESTQRDAKHCTESDLESADLIIALKEAEHRPLMQMRFNGYTDRVEYWNVHDVDQASSDDALPQIEKLVDELISRLQK